MTDHGFLDGNAAAGVLSSMFTVELTSALGQCAGCGRRARLAEARLYGDASGMVLRCVGCEAVLLRLVSGDGRSWLDMRGLSVVELRSSP